MRELFMALAFLTLILALTINGILAAASSTRCSGISTFTRPAAQPAIVSHYFPPQP